MTLKNKDTLLAVSLVRGDHVFLASTKGKGVNIPLDQVVRLSGPGTGVRLMNLGDGRLAGFKCLRLKDKVTLGFDNGTAKEIRADAVPVYNRGAQGIILSKRKKIVSVN